MKKIFLTLIFTTMIAFNSFAGIVQIVAVVNDDVITSYDFYNRVDMAAVNSGVPRNQETFSKLAPIVMQELIYEKLKLQEGEKYGLGISEEEITKALSSIAQRNNMTLEEFEQSLISNGVNIDSLRDQIEANIVWNKYTSRRIAPLVTIPSEEIDEFMDKLLDNEGQTEYSIEEIFISVDTVEAEDEVDALMEEIQTELKSTPDHFSSIASQFSEDLNRGKVGWVLPSSLSPEIAEELSNMDVGDISQTIRTMQGYSIVKLVDKRMVDNSMNEITKKDIDYKLTLEKIEILQKRKLRDLRDTAFIEVKLK